MLIDPRTVNMNLFPFPLEAKQALIDAMVQRKMARFKVASDDGADDGGGETTAAVAPVRVSDKRRKSLFGLMSPTVGSVWGAPQETPRLSRAQLAIECDEEFRNFAGCCAKIDWSQHGVDRDDDGNIDLIELMGIDIGPLMAELYAENRYPVILDLACSSEFNLATAGTEAYVERLFSCANRVMTNANVNLSIVELEQIVLLRMNKVLIKWIIARAEGSSLNPLKERADMVHKVVVVSLNDLTQGSSINYIITQYTQYHPPVSLSN